MNIIEAIKRRILKFLGVEKMQDNPNGERYTYIMDADNIKIQQIQENRMWYIGDGNELLNYYTARETYGDYKDPIYNRNKRNFFWSISTKEGNFKRVHSGIPNAIVTTLVNAIGTPTIKIKNGKDTDELLDKILDANDFWCIYNQRQMPLTMVEGWGAYKINIDASVSEYPVIQYYTAENVEFVYKSGILIAIIYKDYYSYKNKEYLLLETRRKANKTSYIEYELFKISKNNELTPVPMSTIPELADVKDYKIDGLDMVLGVPTKFFFDPLNKDYGRSIFMGKIDLFDDLDQILSQDSQTVRVSTPVEYYPVDLLERGSKGQTKVPNVYNRQFIQKEGIPDGDGKMDSTIQTTQPQLNFEQYSADAKSKLDFILTGLLSPATMGIDIAKKDNADAQREKEKVTIMTRNNVIDRETRALKTLFTLCLYSKDYIDTGKITLKEYDISINYNEFANPSFENEIQVLGPAWNNGQLSTEKYVEMLWGDKISEEDKKKEIAYLENEKNKDNLLIGDFEDEEKDRPNNEPESEDAR